VNQEEKKKEKPHSFVRTLPLYRFEDPLAVQTENIKHIADNDDD